MGMWGSTCRIPLINSPGHYFLTQFYPGLLMKVGVYSRYMVTRLVNKVNMVDYMAIFFLGWRLPLIFEIIQIVKHQLPQVRWEVKIWLDFSTSPWNYMQSPKTLHKWCDLRPPQTKTCSSSRRTSQLEATSYRVAVACTTSSPLRIG